MKNTVAYCSTAFAEPSDPLAGVSAQAVALREYARQRDLTVDGTYMDAGASGVTLIRPALQQLLADCRAGKIAVLLTTDTERLSRDTSELVALLHQFGACGVHVEFATGNDGFKLRDVVLSALAEFQEARVADHARRIHGRG